MSQITIVALDRPGLSPYVISPRLRSQLVYFTAAKDAPGTPHLADHEFWFKREDVIKWADEGVFYLVSPLDTANMTEVELSEEQESFVLWLRENEVQHARVNE